MISRRRLVQAAGLASVTGAGVLHAQQAFPSRPIRLVVPAAAGQSLDVVARYFADALPRRLGAPVIVENKPGAGVAIGTDFVAKAPADGYTVLFGSLPHYVTPYVAEAKVSYDPVRDFTPVAMLCKTSMGIVVGPQSPHKTLADLVNAMKARPQDVTFASGGSITAAHMCMSMLNSQTGTVAKAVTYKNSTTGVLDVATGIVDFTCQGSAAILPLIRSGKLRLLAVTGQRWDSMPDTPTAVEAGFKGVEFSGWIGTLARTGTPPAVVAQLSEAFVAAGQQPEFRKLCDLQQLFPDVYGHERFAAEVPAMAERFRRLAVLAQGQKI